MNKKTLGLLAALCLGAATGCGATKSTVGLGYSAEFKYTADNVETEDKNEENGQLDLTTAFAAFNKKGEVVDVRFDVVQIKVVANEAKDGLTLTNKNVDEAHSVTSKLELGLGYNMKGVSAIGKEVDEQIEAFADWCVGKTVEEIVAGTTGAGHGVAINDELKTSVTIGVDAFEAALKNAYETRTEATYKISKDAKAGIAMQSGLAYNYDNPTKEISVAVAGVMANEGTTEAVQLDEVVVPVAIAENRALSLDSSSKYVQNGVVTSKKDLGDKYAMKSTSANIGKIEGGAEWDEQATTIETATTGKTATEIKALVAGEGELAGATMTVTNYLAAIAKATDYAAKDLISAR